MVFPGNKQAVRQLGWAGDQGEADSYQLQLRWGCCLQKTAIRGRDCGEGAGEISMETLNLQQWVPSGIEADQVLGKKVPGTATAALSLRGGDLQACYSAHNKNGIETTLRLGHKL